MAWDFGSGWLAQGFAELDGVRHIPADTVTTSAGGLDPDVWPANARMQAARIAVTCGVTTADLQGVIDSHTVQPVLGFIGQPAANMLAVDRDLDGRSPMSHPKAP